MEKIKKIINLETFKCRIPTILPYIPTESFEDGEITPTTTDTSSYGEILCYTNENILQDLENFRTALKIVRGGTILKKINRGTEVVYIKNDNVNVLLGDIVAVLESDYNVSIKGIYKEKTFTRANDYICLLKQEDYEEITSVGGAGIIGTMYRRFGYRDVPEDIEGRLVPRYFPLARLNNWLEWFSNHCEYKYVRTTAQKYTAAPETEKAEVLYLPQTITKTSPLYLKIVNEELYYKKIEIEPTECCNASEWKDRGGSKMRKFLVEKQGEYEDTLKFWGDKVDNGEIVAPYITIPIILTQNYNDNGIMSIYDEEAEYCGDEYGTKAGYSGFTTESQLQTLRTNERYYNDEGEVLPYIENENMGNIPYKINEGFNISYDEDEQAFFADYITKIIFRDSDGNTADTYSELTGATFIDFEYVINGKYNASTASTISVTPDVCEMAASGEITSIKVISKNDWALLSNSGSDWLKCGIDTDGLQSGTTTEGKVIKLTASTNTSTSSRSCILKFGTASKKNYEEVECAISQYGKEQATGDTIQFESKYIPKFITFGAQDGVTAGTHEIATTGLEYTAKIVCKNSGWKLKNKASADMSWLSIVPTYGDANIGTTVKISALKNLDSMRVCNLEFVAVKDETKTMGIFITQEGGTIKNL